MKKSFIKNLRGFTFIELLVSIAIIAIIAGGAYLSPGVAGSSVTINQGASEIKNAIEETINFAVGQDRDRVKHYILIIRTSGAGSVPYCNKDVANVNQLEVSQYMICSTKEKVANIETDSEYYNKQYSRVKGGNIPSGININVSSGLSNPIIINVRTFDSQLGFRGKYFDTNPTDTTLISEQSITLIKEGFAFPKVIRINPITNLVSD